MRNVAHVQPRAKKGQQEVPILKKMTGLGPQEVVNARWAMFSVF